MSLLWGIGENNKAKRTTTNTANKTAVQNMILAHIMNIELKIINFAEMLCELHLSWFLIRFRSFKCLWLPNPPFKLYN